MVCARCVLADNPWRRLRGLLGRSELPRGEGLLLRPAGSVHTAFMRFAIDIVFLDDDLGVIGVEPRVPPWRVKGRRGARSVLELPAGEAEAQGIDVGDRLVAFDPGVVEPSLDA